MHRYQVIGEFLKPLRCRPNFDIQDLEIDAIAEVTELLLGFDDEVLRDIAIVVAKPLKKSMSGQDVHAW